jgi:hypothetical protein
MKTYEKVMPDSIFELARICALQARCLLHDGLKSDARELAVRALALAWLASEAHPEPVYAKVIRRS